MKWLQTRYPQNRLVTHWLLFIKFFIALLICHLKSGQHGKAAASAAFAHATILTNLILAKHE